MQGEGLRSKQRTRPLGSRSKQAPSFKRQLPVLLLAALSLYGMYFLYSANSAYESREEAAEDGAADATADDGTFGATALAPSDADQQPPGGAAAVPPYEQPAQQPAQQQPAQQAGDPGGAVAAAAAAGGGGDGCNRSSSSSVGGRRRPPPHTSGLMFRGAQHLELVPSDEVAGRLASGALSVSAWLHLPELFDGEVDTSSIQTVLASKASGCAADESHQGVSLFVNAWNTNSSPRQSQSHGARRSRCVAHAVHH